MVEEPTKKFAVGEMPPSPTTSNHINSSTNTHKKPTRHHVKRRSSGRVHVTKLAPMARANVQPTVNNIDPDADFVDEDQEEQQPQPQQQQQQSQQQLPQEQPPSRKPMKRSHSSKSIHRLSSNDAHRKVNLSGFTMTTKAATATATTTTTNTTTTPSQIATHDSPPITPTDQQPTAAIATFASNNTDTGTVDVATTDVTSDNDGGPSATPVPSTTVRPSNKTKPVTSPSFQVSHQSTAAPIAHMLNATANTLVTPDKPALANLTTTSTISVKSPTVSNSSNNNRHDNNNSSKSKHLYSRFIDQSNSNQDIPRTVGSIDHHQRQSLQQRQPHPQQQRHHQQQSIQHQQQTSSSSRTSAPTDDLALANLSIAAENVDKEYQSIHVYQDPMVASLARCIQQRQLAQHRHSQGKPSSSQVHLQRLGQMGAHQRTFSSSILPTMATLSSSSSSSGSSSLLTPAFGVPLPSQPTPPQQHIEHRQIARRRHQRLQAEQISSMHPSSSTDNSNTSNNKQNNGRWSAGAFLDRMFYGTS